MYKLLTRINTLKRCKWRLLHLIIATTFIIILPVLGFGQTQRQLITVDFKNITIKDAFKELNNRAGLKFVYSPKDLDENKRVSGKFVDKSTESVINFLLSGMDVTYSVKDNTIVIRKVVKSRPQTIQQRSITGQVLDEQGQPLGNVTVKTNSSSHQAVTDDHGNFNITIAANDSQLQFSLLGYGQSQIDLTEQASYKVHLVSAEQGLDEVVVVGYGTQKKVNLTGSVSAISGDELSKKTGRANVNGIAGSIAGSYCNPAIRTTGIGCGGYSDTRNRYTGGRKTIGTY